MRLAAWLTLLLSPATALSTVSAPDPPPSARYKGHKGSPRQQRLAAKNSTKTAGRASTKTASRARARSKPSKARAAAADVASMSEIAVMREHLVNASWTASNVSVLVGKLQNVLLTAVSAGQGQPQGHHLGQRAMNGPASEAAGLAKAALGMVSRLQTLTAEVKASLTSAAPRAISGAGSRTGRATGRHFSVENCSSARSEHASAAVGSMRAGGGSTLELLDTRSLVRAFRHADNFPMYATNPSVIDEDLGLYAVRITALTTGILTDSHSNARLCACASARPAARSLPDRYVLRCGPCACSACRQIAPRSLHASLWSLCLLGLPPDRSQIATCFAVVLVAACSLLPSLPAAVC